VASSAQRRKVWLTPTTRLPRSNAANNTYYWQRYTEQTSSSAIAERPRDAYLTSNCKPVKLRLLVSTARLEG